MIQLSIPRFMHVVSELFCYRVSTKKGSFSPYHRLVKDPIFVDTLY